MRGNDFVFVRHSELIKQFNRMLHRFPIGLAAHDDGDQRRR